MLKGVKTVEPGYSGGHVDNPTYDQVSSGKSGHAEVIKIEYDPEQVAFEELLRVFFATHDPTTINRQGNDVGSQYRSVIFYTTERQKEKAEHYIETLNAAARSRLSSDQSSQGNTFPHRKSTSQKIVTTVEPFMKFYPAEDYHQKYFENHPDATYCQLIIAPKVEKVEKKFRHLLKE